MCNQVESRWFRRLSASERYHHKRTRSLGMAPDSTTDPPNIPFDEAQLPTDLFPFFFVVFFAVVIVVHFFAFEFCIIIEAIRFEFVVIEAI